MSEPQTDTNTPAQAEPQSKPSPLGVDPEPATPVEPQEPAAPVEASQPQQQKPSMSQEEIDALLEKASNYDLIANDPELATKIRDHFTAKTGRVPQADQQSPAEPQEPTDNAQSQQIKELIRRNAANEIALFRMQHPDMDDYRDEMTHLVSQYGMPLEDAYRFSKGIAAQKQKPTSRERPATPTVETTNPAGVDQNEDPFDIAEVERKIADSKATPRFDDALDLAIAAAKRKHANS